MQFKQVLLNLVFDFLCAQIIRRSVRQKVRFWIMALFSNSSLGQVVNYIDLLLWLRFRNHLVYMLFPVNNSCLFNSWKTKNIILIVRRIRMRSGVSFSRKSWVLNKLRSFICYWRFQIINSWKIVESYESSICLLSVN